MTTLDAIDRAIGASRSDPLHDLRALRPEFVKGSEASRLSVLEPDEDLGLSRDLRRAIGRRVAATGKHEGLLALYPSPEDPSLTALAEGTIPTDPALAALARHADMIATDPAQASAGHLQTLLDAGYDVPQIIALSELLAQVCYQIRVVHGLSLLRETPA